MVTNYSGEMSFFTLKRIKNQLSGHIVPGYVVHSGIASPKMWGGKKLWGGAKCLILGE